MLLLKYWTAESQDNQLHWNGKINGFRPHIKHRLTGNLYNYLVKYQRLLVQDALVYARQKTGFKVQ